MAQSFRKRTGDLVWRVCPCLVLREEGTPGFDVGPAAVSLCIYPALRLTCVFPVPTG